MKKLILFILIAFNVIVTFAQTPTTIPGKIAYQGKLLENGTPVTGTRTIDFSIPGTGWTETHAAVSITEGLYSVQLGSVTPIPVTVFNSPAVSLEVTVEGTTLSPQVELLSVPYAYNAESAANISGNPVSATIPAIGQTLQWDGTAWVPGDAASKAYVDALMDGLGVIKDIDGNYYKTVLIGNQTWMAENLKTTHYENGDEIPNGTGAGDISGETDPKYWFAYNDDLNNVPTYGRLYTWYAVADNRNVCPSGWHVPSDDEWKQLEMFLGLSQAQANATLFRGTNEGSKLKEAGTMHWTSPNTGATNEASFTGLPGGFRHYTGTYDNIGGSSWSIGNWWTAMESDATNAWYHSLYHGTEKVSRSIDHKKKSISVRCVKN